MKKLVLGLISAIMLTTMAEPCFAETVIEKVSRTGVLTAGTRNDLVPLAYINDKGEWVGYSIDMINLVKAELEARLGRKIELQLEEVNFNQRVSKVVNGDVDIICEGVNFTWERLRHVDFSVSYGVSGVSILGKKGNNLATPESLNQKKIGAIPGSLGDQVMRLVQPKAIFVPITNIGDAVAKLNDGSVDAIAGGTLLLEGFRQTLDNPNNYEVYPPDKPFSREGIVCMLPRNDSSFRNLVNYSLIKYMQGIVSGDPKSVASFNRWFGPNGEFPVKTDRALDFFRFVVDSHEQIKF